MRVIISPIIAECEFWAVLRHVAAALPWFPREDGRLLRSRASVGEKSSPFSLGIDPITARTSLKPKAVSNRQDAALVPRATLQTGGGGRTRP